MPLPLSHSLAGLGLHVAADRGGPRGGMRLLLAVVVANAPDLDMIPGLLVGDPNRFHQGPTHSFAAALLVGLVAWAWVRMRSAGARAAGGSGAPRRRPAAGRRVLGVGVFAALLWSSHVLLDMLTEDLTEPVGVPALWPVSMHRYQLLPVFSRADKLVGPGGVGEFLVSLATWHNAVALAREALIMAPLVVLALWWARRRGDRPGDVG